MTDQPEEMAPTPSREEYVQFISQIELLSVWLNSARVTNASGGRTPSTAAVSIDSSTKWELFEDGFVVFDKYVVEFKDGRKKLSRVEVQFGLQYESEIVMTDQLFGTFEENNLPLNSWPYLREFLASVVARMNWLPFTLPAKKILPDQESVSSDE